MLREVSKDLVSGIYYLQGLYVHRNSSRPASSLQQPLDTASTAATSTELHEEGDPAPVPGFVVVQDLTTGRTLAQFRSHSAEVEIMAFNPNGVLLATAPVGGQTVHIHRIEPGIGQSGKGRQRLLYKLERGLTHASIRSIAFSNDLRWVALASSSGTAHVFAINFGGGPVDAYTHPAVLADAEETNSSDNNNSSKLSSSLRSISKLSPSGSSAASLSPNWKDKVVQAVSRRLPVSVVNKQLYATLGEVDAKVFVSTKPLRVKRDDRCVVLYPLARVRQRVSYAHLDKPSGAGLDQSVAYPLDLCFESSKLRVMSATGVLEHYELVPYVTASEQDVLCLEVHPRNRWDVCRREDWPGICASPLVEKEPTCNPTHNNTNGSPELGLAKGDLLRGDWLSRAEIKSHESPIIPLWGSPQFRFMTLNERYGELPLFVESVAATAVKVRGAGPSPIDPGSGRLVRRLDSDSDKHMKAGVKVAIATPTRFQNLHVASEKEAAETILVYDDDEGSGGRTEVTAHQERSHGHPEWLGQNGDVQRQGGESEEEVEVEGYGFDDHADDIFLQDEELYGDAILEEMKRRKQQKLKEN